MSLIWCAISGHGYGHAAQVVPVLNALGALVPSLTAVLRTTVPSSFFRDRLAIQWELSPAQQDIGCVQDGPLKIDIEATWAAHQRFHETWEARLSNEVAAMQAASPALVIADTPYLAIEAGSLCTDTHRRLGELYLGPRAQGVLPRIRQSTPAVDSVHPWFLCKSVHGPSHLACSQNRCLLQHYRYWPDSQPHFP